MSRTRILAAVSVAVALTGAAWGYEPTGLTSDGRVVHANENKRAPWNPDRVKYERGDYPYLARLQLRKGKGWFRLELRRDGSVATVKVMQSTGSIDLDQSAIVAFLRWRFKPGKWKWLDEYMEFRMYKPDRGIQRP
jgi:TonB family protein